MNTVVALSALWAVGTLGAQLVSGWRARHPDHSRQSGNPARGVAYGFTVAMTPARKESVSRHPIEFAVGVLMHVGIAICLAGLALLVTRPATGAHFLALLRPIVGASLLAGIYLLARRATSPELRVMSVPDDYVAIVATCGLLTLALVASLYRRGEPAYLAYGAVLLMYLPLGKLRHAVFFFAARGDLWRRLGRREAHPSRIVG